MTTSHERFIQECYGLATSAVHRGNRPFGALLARNDRIVLTAENTVETDSDCTRHAELNLVSHALRKVGPEVVRECILYTSTEPCVMCTGAIYWAQIPVVVYGCSAEALRLISGDPFIISCREILGRGRHPTQVIGPVLEEEGLQIHRRFWG
jgi:tRNA(Arg) A34 adenosine deaminase TadA